MRHALSAALVAVCVLAAACDSSTEPLKPASLTPTTAVEQDGTVAATAGVAPAVRVTTAAGKPVPGVEVTFAVTQGGGSLAVMAVRTDADGTASAGTWTLGTGAGTHEVVATTSALPAARAVFRANAAAAAPGRLVIVTQPPTQVLSGAPVSPHPAVQLLDDYGNAAPVAGIVITAQIVGGSATLANATASTNAQGSATFTNLIVEGQPGTYTLQFGAPSMAPVYANGALSLLADAATCTTPALAMALGELQRYTLASGALPCLRFDGVANAGQQFMLLFENMPLFGGYETGIFPGAVTDTTFQLTLRLRPQTVTSPAQPALRSLTAAAPRHDAHAWDFGEGPIYEYEPPLPAEGVPQPQLLRDGRLLNLQSATAAPQIGDTVVVRMEGIQRLGIVSGNQRAVIRHISNELIIAEDVRLGTTLVRQGGGYNTPLTATDLSDIAREYAAIARVQGDLVFEGRFNSAIEVDSPPRVLAVHSLMGSDGVWGYTYSTGNYFVWDYWVGTDGATRGLSQHPHRVADNLFMHEIAHMRHVGMLQRNGISTLNRGNRWLVEGFARHSERFAIAHRLLGSVTPSRTSNLELPRNPAFGNSYFRDDVPTFLNGGTSMFGGYQHASFVFDYLMDQVALGGGDYMAALRDLLIHGGIRTTADAAVSRWLPGLTFAELFTRARIALYLDDIGTPGLPAWTQYHQYQLRTSRPAGSAAASDPRTAWPKLTPGSLQDVQITVPNGAAYGVILDGTQGAAASAVIRLDVPFATGNAVVSITRIR